MKKKTIVHIITRLINGGADENTVISCNYSVSIGNQVFLLIGSESQKEIIHKLDKRVKLIIIKNLIRPINPLKDILALIQIKNFLKRLSPDIVHTHTSKAGIIGRIAAWLNKIPLIVHTVHILPFLNVNLFKKIFYLLVERIVAKTTHRFINVSSGMMETSLRYGIGVPSKHSIIYSAFDTNKFKNAQKSTNLIESFLNNKLPKDSKIILMLGAFEKRKRHEQLVNIFSSISKKFPNTILLLAGEGNQMLVIKDQVKKLKLEHKVIFTGFRDDPEKIIALADICILNSIREGLPRVVIQYIAGGKPTISTNLPGIEEILKDQVNGYIIDMLDPKILYNKLYNLLSDQNKIMELANGAKNTDVSNWSIDRMGKKIDNLYNSEILLK